MKSRATKAGVLWGETQREKAFKKRRKTICLEDVGERKTGTQKRVEKKKGKNNSTLLESKIRTALLRLKSKKGGA